MPVWLDAIPEKATKIARPSPRRWLLFLAFVMLGGVTLTLWSWTSERTGFAFWFTALGLPFCTWGLIFGLRRFAYKAEQVTPLDSGRTQLVWVTQDGNTLKFILRSELGDGPLALLKLQGFRLPESIFNVEPGAENLEQFVAEDE